MEAIERLYNQIIDEYGKGHSIADIARKLRTTQVRVQRVLITEGLWTSKRTEQIAAMRNKGMTVHEIAEALGKDEKTIQTFLPYSRGQYGREVTAESLKAKKYRERMKKAALNMLEGAKDMNSGIKEYGASKIFDYEEYIKDINLKKEEVNKNPFLSDSSVYRVRFELCSGFYYGASSDLGLEEYEKEEFLKYAKADEGIVREVLIPGDMNLHALHYLIQRMFGWQNSHLHHFSLSQDNFQKITDGRLDKWMDMCGKLFRFSTGNMEDLYWDDDYKLGISVKSWLKSKYKAPYIQKAYSDTEFCNKEKIQEFKKQYSDIPENIALEELSLKLLFDEDYNTLLEGLTLHELLPVFKDIYYLYDYGDDWCVHISMIAKYDRKTNTELQEGFNDGWGMVDILEQKDELSKNRYFIDDGELNIDKELEEMLAKQSENRNTSVGADDIIDISGLLDASWKNVSFESEVDEELRSVLAVVDVKKMPICTHVDGLGVFDDVGGVSGMLDFYRIINGDNTDEKTEMKEWARSLGWTGRMSKAEKML